MKQVGVIKYGAAGNIGSVAKALKKVGTQPKTVECPKDLVNLDGLVLPGVGTFKSAMQFLTSCGLDLAIKQFDRPKLGICLGMQLLGNIGHEGGATSGLAEIDGEVRLVDCKGKIPHLGFNTIELLKQSDLIRGLESEEFYFMHSYEFNNYTDVIALTTYANHKFVSVLEKKSIFGVQFHPEKSREPGLGLFENFIRLSHD